MAETLYLAAAYSDETKVWASEQRTTQSGSHAWFLKPLTIGIFVHIHLDKYNFTERLGELFKLLMTATKPNKGAKTCQIGNPWASSTSQRCPHSVSVVWHISRTKGAIILHGPHHTAEKSITTNLFSLPARNSVASTSAKVVCSKTAPPRNTPSAVFNIVCSNDVEDTSVVEKGLRALCRGVLVVVVLALALLRHADVTTAEEHMSWGRGRAWTAAAAASNASVSNINQRIL
jgi:hypothetical protein